MPLVPAKCPGCGGDIQVDNSRKEAFCSYCGTKFLVESAVSYYNTKNEYHIDHADINVEDSKSLETRLKNAETHLTKLKDYKRATKLFQAVTEEFADDYRGWWGILRSITREFTGVGANAYMGEAYDWLKDEDLSKESPLMMAYRESKYYRSATEDVPFNLDDVSILTFVSDRAIAMAPDSKAEELRGIWEAYAKKARRCEDKYRELWNDRVRMRQMMREARELGHKKLKPFRRINDLNREIERIKEKYKGWKLEPEIRWPRYCDDDSDKIPEDFFTFEEWENDWGVKLGV